MDEYRLELVGFNGAALDSYKAMGGFTEIIAWTTRLFLPVNDEAVLVRLLDRHPITAEPTARVAA